MDKYRYNGQRALPLRQQLRYLCRSDTKLGSALLAAIALCVYGFLGVLGFHILQLEPGWSLVNAVYFSTATCATVGYGDLYPSSATSRIFTIVMMVVGVGLVFPVFASGVARVLFHPISERGRAALERIFPQRKVDIDYDGDADFYVPSPGLIFWIKNLTPSLLLNLAVQCISAAIFVGLEGWDYGTAYYHCLITATTIGYGDVSIQSTAGQWFASFHMMFSVALVAELLGSIKVIADLHKALLRRTRMLEMKLNGTLLERMQWHAKELRPPASPNSVRSSKDANEGINELEFAMGMLIELGMVTTDQVLPFLKQFRALDVSADGNLDGEDLSISTRLSPEALSSLQKANSEIYRNSLHQAVRLGRSLTRSLTVRVQTSNESTTSTAVESTAIER